MKPKVHTANESSFPAFQQNENKWEIPNELGDNFCIEWMMWKYAGLGSEKGELLKILQDERLPLHC